MNALNREDEASVAARLESAAAALTANELNDRELDDMAGGRVMDFINKYFCGDTTTVNISTSYINVHVDTSFGKNANSMTSTSVMVW